MMQGSEYVTRSPQRPMCRILVCSFLLLVLAGAITGCDSAKGRAEADAIRSDARMRAIATHQALDIQATVTAIEAQEDLGTQPERIRNRESREWWFTLIMIAFAACLAALGVGLVAGTVKAHNTKALNEARTYRPDPQTGTLPVVRIEHVPRRTARLAYEMAPLIRLIEPSYLPKPLQYATMLVDLDTGAQVRIRQVIDEQGRLHIWQETHLAPPGQHALAHHTRRVVALGNAIASMKQKHGAAGEIAHAVPQVGHIPTFQPSYGSENGDGGLVQIEDDRNSSY